MSVPQIPQAPTRKRTSPSEILGIGRVSTTTRPFPRYTPARIWPLPGYGDDSSPILLTVWLMSPLSMLCRGLRLQNIGRVGESGYIAIEKLRERIRRALAVLTQPNESRNGARMKYDLPQNPGKADLPG